MCQHPTHSFTCNCGYVIQPGSDHAIAADREKRYNSGIADIKERYKGATYSKSYNRQLTNEAKNNFRRNFR